MKTDAPTTKEQLFALLDLLKSNGVRVWVHGGWALDALCGGSRPHKDIDLFASECDRERLITLFGANVLKQTTHKLVVTFEGAEVEITFFARGHRGNFYTITPRIIVRWSPWAFGERTAILDGRPIPIVSPETLYGEVFNTTCKKREMLEKNERDKERVRGLLTPAQRVAARRFFPRPNNRWNRLLMRLGLW